MAARSLLEVVKSWLFELFEWSPEEICEQKCRDFWMRVLCFSWAYCNDARHNDKAQVSYSFGGECVAEVVGLIVVALLDGDRHPEALAVAYAVTRLFGSVEVLIPLYARCIRVFICNTRHLAGLFQETLSTNLIQTLKASVAALTERAARASHYENQCG